MTSKIQSLKDLLNNQKCFKLICGAGNENLDEIEKLVAVYARAGCRFFDFAASEDVLKSAQKGLDSAVPKEDQSEYHFCVSVGTKNDQHVQKSRINPEFCKRCEQCIKACPQAAINQYFKVIKDKCIGCLKCKSACKHGAIEIYSESKPFTVKHPLLTCVELHASDIDEKEVDDIWDKLQDFEGMLSLCIGRSNLSVEQILARIKRLVKIRPPYTTIIQADGVPMSGGDNDEESSLPAIEMGKFVQSLNLPVYLVLSGGTNAKTAELARVHGVNINGVAVGSYARKILKDYINRPDFWENSENLTEAVNIAKTLVESV